MALQQIILRGWKGEASLATAFWGYFILGQLEVGLALITLFSPLLLLGQKGIAIGKFFTYPAYWAFLAWALVSIWGSASNTQSKFWGRTAKGFVILYSFVWAAATMEAILGGP